MFPERIELRENREKRQGFPGGTCSHEKLIVESINMDRGGGSGIEPKRISAHEEVFSATKTRFRR